MRHPGMLGIMSGTRHNTLFRIEVVLQGSHPITMAYFQQMWRLMQIYYNGGVCGQMSMGIGFFIM